MALHWTDENGVKRRVVTSMQPLYPGTNKNHAALRAYVYRRDGFMCRRCGVLGQDIPEPYDGKTNLYVTRISGPRTLLGYLVLDHITPRKKGGRSHPANLQTLCDGCNTVKRDRAYEYPNRNTELMRKKFAVQPRKAPTPEAAEARLAIIKRHILYDSEIG